MRRRTAAALSLSSLIGAAVAVGCGGATVQRQGGPFAGDAANAAFLIEGEEVRLTGGRSTTGAGDATVETQLTDGRLEGDLDGDGVTDLLVIVARDTGSGATFHLAALVSEGQGYRPVAAARLGERLVVKNLGFDGSDIKLRLVVPDPENADPRPSKIVERRFRFQGGALHAVETE